MRPENTIERNMFGYILKFTDKYLFDLFIDYVKGSIVTKIRHYNGPFRWSLYEHYITRNGCDSKNGTVVTVGLNWGAENIIGKFFLETDLDLPKGIINKGTNPHYKQPTLGSSIEVDYGRGVDKVILGGEGEGVATVPKEIIHRLQTLKDETVEAVIQKAYHKLVKENLYLAPVLWRIVLTYLTRQDNRDMVMKFASESKLSFFAQQISQKDIAADKCADALGRKIV